MPPSPSSHDELVGWEDVNKSRLLTLLPLGSTAVRCLVYPISLVKTRMQTGSGGGMAYTGPFQALRTIVKEEGFAGLYKGFGVSMVGIIVGPIYISTLETTRSSVSSSLSGTGLSATHVSVAASLLGGFVASGMAQTMMVPVDVVSQRLMLQRVDAAAGVVAGAHAQSPLDIVRTVVRQEGLRGLYRGYGLAFMTYVPTSSLLWASFEFIHRNVRDVVTDALRERRRRAGDAAVDDDTALMAPWLSYGLTAACGASAGAIAAVTTNPLDVLRTRVQTHPTPITLRATMTAVITDFGPLGFFRGAFARVLAMAPTSCLMLTAYHFLLRHSLDDAPEEDSFAVGTAPT